LGGIFKQIKQTTNEPRVRASAFVLLGSVVVSVLASAVCIFCFYLPVASKETAMTDETLLILLDVLDGLADGYRECAQKMHLMERALAEEGSDSSLKLYAHYLRVKTKVDSVAKIQKTEPWHTSALRIETMLAGLREECARNRGGTVA
jgi:hypothetical protein